MRLLYRRSSIIVVFVIVDVVIVDVVVDFVVVVHVIVVVGCSKNFHPRFWSFKNDVEPTDGRTDGRTVGRTDGRTNWRTDTVSSRDAESHLKRDAFYGRKERDNHHYDSFREWRKVGPAWSKGESQVVVKRRMRLVLTFDYLWSGLFRGSVAKPISS